jgi:hypothetical protein
MALCVAYTKINREGRPIILKAVVIKVGGDRLGQQMRNGRLDSSGWQNNQYSYSVLISGNMWTNYFFQAKVSNDAVALATLVENI